MKALTCIATLLVAPSFGYGLLSGNYIPLAVIGLCATALWIKQPI